MPDNQAKLRRSLARWAQDYTEDLKRFLAKRRIVEADIKDLCQEVYLRLLRFERVEVVKNPQAYLFRVAANVAHDFKLRQQRWLPLDPEHQEEASSAPGPDEVAESGTRRERVARALARLPPLPRAALTLQADDDLTYEQIAARLGVSRRSVKRAIARGYDLLRKELTDES